MKRVLAIFPILCLVLLAISFPLVKAVEDSPELWSKTYGGNGKDASTSLVQTSDGGYALAGFTYSSGYGDSDALLVKQTSMETWNGIKQLVDQTIIVLIH